MARNYKQVTNHEKDAANASGGWNKVAKFAKNTPNSSGTGYLDRVTINYLVDDIDGADSLRNAFPFGHFFVLSRESAVVTHDSESNMLNPAHFLDVGARDGGAGSITLYARGKIAENTTDIAEGDGYIYLWQKNTDLTVDDNIIMRYYIETYGRWVECVDV